MSVKFCVVLVVGPGQREIDRAKDLIESLETYESGNFRLVLVDDDLHGRQLLPKVAPNLKNGSEEILSPRRGRACGWGSGLTAAVLDGLRLAAVMRDVDFVLKVDTDSLVIRSFSDEIVNRFEEFPRVGMLGSYEYNPNRLSDREQSRASAPAYEKLLRQFTLWRRTSGGGPKLQVAFWGRFKKIRDAIRSALLQGYRLSEHCSGGGYAICGPCLRALLSKEYLDDPCIWLYTPCSEDTVVSMYVRAVGFFLQDYNLDGEPFGVQHLGLPDTPERMLARGFAIIHSLKDRRDQQEEDARAFFKMVREKDCVVPGGRRGRDI